MRQYISIFIVCVGIKTMTYHVIMKIIKKEIFFSTILDFIYVIKISAVTAQYLLKSY